MADRRNLTAALTARYGTVSGPRRARIIAAVGSALTVAVVTFAYLVSTSPSVRFALTAFDVIDDTSVSVTWSVTRAPDATSYCVVRAQDANRQDVGYATVEVAGGPAQVQMTYHLATESRAVLAEVLACSDRAAMRAPAPNFAPGVKIPDQLPPGVAPTK